MRERGTNTLRKTSISFFEHSQGFPFTTATSITCRSASSLSGCMWRSLKRPSCPSRRGALDKTREVLNAQSSGRRKRARDRGASPFQDCGCRIVFATLKSEMGKNVKHKGPNARAREREKGHKLGPKIIGATKPPNGLQPSYTGFSSKRFASKKAKKAAATAAAWALLANSDDRKGQRKQKFSY